MRDKQLILDIPGKVCQGKSSVKEEAEAKRREFIERGDFGILDRTDKPADLGDVKIVNSSKVSL